MAGWLVNVNEELPSNRSLRPTPPPDPDTDPSPAELEAGQEDVAVAAVASS